MKTILLALSILFSAQCLGQKWHLNNVDTTREFPFEYWFQFEKFDESQSFELKRESGKQASTINLIDHFGDSVPFVDLQIENIEIDTLIKLTTDYQGKATVHLENGEYSLTNFDVHFGKMEIEFKVDNNEHIRLIVNTGHPKGIVYQIDSQYRLTEEEALEIMLCVKSNPKDYPDTCADKEKFRLMEHL